MFVGAGVGVRVCASVRVCLLTCVYTLARLRHSTVPGHHPALDVSTSRRYLSAKRAKFPNFYFVSDTALLELLSGSVASVSSHVASLFDAVSSLCIDRFHRL